jgi:hypothetical protein
MAICADCTGPFASKLAPTFGMQSPVGVSLLAMGLFQSMDSNQTDRYREQAHSYRGRVHLPLCFNQPQKLESFLQYPP